MIKRSDISELEQLAASQWGMFTIAQAQARGLRRNQVSRMVASMRVEPMCYGVYRFVAGSEPVHADLKAAWLSVFPKETAAERISKRPLDAVVAAGTAAAALGAGDFHMSPYTFITAVRKQTVRGDMRFLECSLDESDVVMVDGLPTTSFERTVFDLLRLDEDPSLVDGFMCDAARSRAYTFDFERLSGLLGPIASRHGFPGGGRPFAADLILRNMSDVLIDRVRAALQGAIALPPDVLKDAGIASGLEALQGVLLDSNGSLHLDPAKDMSSPGVEAPVRGFVAATKVLPKPGAEGIASALERVARPVGASGESDWPVEKEERDG